VVIFPSQAEENREVDKRYIAALAKNGRLPKFAHTQKKDEGQEESVQSSEKEDTEEDYSKDTLSEDKRHIGAFLKMHGKPFSTRSNGYDDSNRDDKRNIASMARLGRLNNYHFSRYENGKRGRMGGEDRSDIGDDQSISIYEDPNCIDTDEHGGLGPDETPIWMKKKRYVAALARSGRLPVWHSQRMWPAGKRDDSRPYWSSSRIEANNGDNTLDDMPFVSAKNKRCRKIYEYQAWKRNIAALARNGKLPFRPHA